MPRIGRRRRMRRWPSWLDWKSLLIGLLTLMLWSAKRRRHKSDFELSDRTDVTGMIPSFIGITEGAIDPGNRVEIVFNGRYFDRLLEDIRQARQSIHIETYIWWKGEICARVAGALAERSRAGVEVRLLVDASGSETMEHHVVKQMRDAGCQVRFFQPFRISNVGRMNNRTHRKIAVFDGRIGYVGGHGIAEEWTGHAQDKDHWRDTAVRMEGPVVNTVQGVFCENWIEETGSVTAGDRYFPKLQPAGETDAHVAFASPRGSLSAVQLLYYLAIAAAEKELIIQNPYFLPHNDAIEEMKNAVRRGVDVQIMLPAAGVIDLPSVQHASHHHYGDLLENGVRIFEYQRTLLHSKVMIVDGIWCCVGSTNFDDRSFQLNDEITVGFTSAAMAAQLKAAYVDDMRQCKEIRLAEWKRRPWTHKLIDGAMFLGRREL
jgi:cardiolipin synthase